MPIGAQQARAFFDDRYRAAIRPAAQALHIKRSVHALPVLLRCFLPDADAAAVAGLVGEARPGGALQPERFGAQAGLRGDVEQPFFGGSAGGEQAVVLIESRAARMRSGK